MSRGDRFLVYLLNNDVNTMAYDVIYDITVVLYLYHSEKSCSLFCFKFLRIEG